MARAGPRPNRRETIVRPSRPGRGPAAARRVGPARPAGGDVTGERDQPTRRPAWPTTQIVVNALHTGVLGSACAYGRSRRLPVWAASWRGGVAPAGRIGIALAGSLHIKLQFRGQRAEAVGKL